MFVAVYTHTGWTEMLSKDNLTCEERLDMSFRRSALAIPVDGSKATGYVTRTERNWFHPSMYYMAVMDCENWIEKMLGENKKAKLELEAEMLADDEHFSYEKRNSITIDSYLLCGFIVLFMVNIVDLRRFSGEFDTTNSPHVYCLAAMFF